MSSPGPIGRGGQTAPVTTEQPPSPSGDNNSGQSNQRRVGTTQPNAQHSVQQGQQSQGQMPAGAPRSASPTNASPAVNPQQAAAIEQLKAQRVVLQKSLYQLVSDMWVRDQLANIQDIIKDPEMAKLMGAVIKVQPPGAKEPVQLFPPLEGKDALPQDVRSSYVDFLSTETAHLQKELHSKRPETQMLQDYASYRQQMIEASEMLGDTNFQWPSFYSKLLTSAIEQQLQSDKSTMLFHRGPFDPSQKLSPEAIAELNRKMEAKAGKQSKQQPAGHESDLNDPQIEFRMRTTPEEFKKHQQKLQQMESHARKKQ